MDASEIQGVYEDEGVQMPDEVKAGDLVVCSINGKNFSEPDNVGKVLKVPKKQVKLSAGHRDGTGGDLYVLHYYKRPFRGSLSNATLKKSKFIHDCLCINATYFLFMSVCTLLSSLITPAITTTLPLFFLFRNRRMVVI